MVGYHGETEQPRVRAEQPGNGSGQSAPSPAPAAPPVHASQGAAGGGLGGAVAAAAPGDRPRRGGGGPGQARRLIAAANELLVLAAELERADWVNSEGHEESGATVAVPAGLAGSVIGFAPPEDERRWLRHARQTYRRRRSRALFFEESLFGEPAWDLLLDLFIAAKERKRVPVTSACIGAAVPTTTALRWLAILEERGLVLREADPTDARRIFVRLTTDAYARMVAYFARAVAAESDDGWDGSRPRGG